MFKVRFHCIKHAQYIFSTCFLSCYETLNSKRFLNTLPSFPFIITVYNCIKKWGPEYIYLQQYTKNNLKIFSEKKKNFSEEIENIKKHVSQNLKPLARSSTRRYIRIPITSLFHIYLRNIIKLNGRFRTSPLMIATLQLPTHRQIEKNKMCVVTQFQAKIAKSKEDNGFRGMPILSIRFIRKDEFLIEN